jgi:hypothetical protein
VLARPVVLGERSRQQCSWEFEKRLQGAGKVKRLSVTMLKIQVNDAGQAILRKTGKVQPPCAGFGGRWRTTASNIWNASTLAVCACEFGPSTAAGISCTRAAFCCDTEGQLSNFCPSPVHHHAKVIAFKLQRLVARDLPSGTGHTGPGVSGRTS